jgi:hypothetical protein
MYFLEDREPRRRILPNATQMRQKKFEKFRLKLVTILTRLNPDAKASLLEMKIKQEDVLDPN